jgi:biotin carboxyl carrier protein
VITLLVESRSRQAVQSVIALVEVLAGYVFTHEAQQSLKKSRQASASLDLAARLIAAMNSAQGFRGCAMQLVNDLCRQLAVDRVALGWVEGSPARYTSSSRITPVPGGKRTVKLMALSDTEHFDRRMAMCRSIEAAMEECLDQEQAVLFPAPDGQGPTGDIVLSQAITHAHRDLVKGDAGVRVASLPLRLTDAGGERIAGVLLLEARAEATLGPGAMELLQATLDLTSPVLAVRASDDRSLAQRTGDWLLRTLAWAVGPKHTAWKAAGIALMLTSLVLLFGKTTYRVGAPMTLEPVVKRTVTAPVAGMLMELSEGIRPGALVREGDILAKLDTRELRLSMLEAAAQAQQSAAQEAEALKQGDHAQAAQAKARGEQAAARRDLLALQIERSTIVSPIAGTLIQGDLKDRLGATIRAGDELFQVADTSAMMVVARVEDADIALVRVGQTGEVSPKADPSLTVPFVVDQIVPLSRAAEGSNVFEVRGSLASGQREWFLPGLEGRAKINTQRKSLGWIASRRIVDQLRVWLWW